VSQSWVYIALCCDGTFYVGCTSNPQLREAQHNSGIGSRYTSKRLPIRFVFVQEFPNLLQAAEAERHLKTWSHGKKEALVKGDFDLLHELAKCRNESRSQEP
jgi:putative endonuclease